MMGLEKHLVDVLKAEILQCDKELERIHSVLEEGYDVRSDIQEVALHFDHAMQDLTELIGWQEATDWYESVS